MCALCVHDTNSAYLGFTDAGDVDGFCVVFSTHYTLKSISNEGLGEQVGDTHKLTVI